MVMVPITIAGPSYEVGQQFDAQRTINLYPVVSESGTSKSVVALKHTPGLSEYATVGDGPICGLHVAAGRLFVVSAGWLYEWTGSAVPVGSVGGAQTPVVMANSGVELAIATGDNLYIVNLSTLAVTATGYRASSVAFVDGYFLFTETDTGKLWLTGIYDGATIDALDFSTAESNPDNLVHVHIYREEAWLFGDQTTEVWYNSGDADQPFQPISGGAFPMGCVARHSVRTLDGTVFWVGRDENGSGIVYRAAGYTPNRVSTEAVETAIAAGDLANAQAWTYQMDGHSFYVLNVPGIETSWAFDVLTGMWHERSYRNSSTGHRERHRAVNHVFYGGQHVVGDYESGTLYALSSGVYQDNGNPIVRLRRTPHTHSEGRRLFFSRFELDMEVGRGPADNSIPYVMLRTSSDGGKTWGNERWASAGRIGEYLTRVFWTRCGAARSRVWEVATSYDAPVTFIAARADTNAQGA